MCVANAGLTTTIAPAHRMTAEQWQHDIDVNLTGAFRTVQACLGGMRERRYGRIVVISSVAAAGRAARAGRLRRLQGRPARAWCRTLASENAALGITANAILPGLVATEQVLAMPDEVRERVIGSLPSGRPVEPAEIAAAVAFLAGEEAAQITGQSLLVDGGASLTQLSLGSSPKRLAHREMRAEPASAGRGREALIRLTILINLIVFIPSDGQRPRTAPRPKAPSGRTPRPSWQR